MYIIYSAATMLYKAAAQDTTPQPVELSFEVDINN